MHADRKCTMCPAPCAHPYCVSSLLRLMPLLSHCPPHKPHPPNRQWQQAAVRERVQEFGSASFVAPGGCCATLWQTQRGGLGRLAACCAACGAAMLAAVACRAWPRQCCHPPSSHAPSICALLVAPMPAACRHAPPPARRAKQRPRSRPAPQAIPSRTMWRFALWRATPMPICWSGSPTT